MFEGLRDPITRWFFRSEEEIIELIDEFVEDFKASAPIWKYDLKNGNRIYALDRSTAIEGSGILGVKK